jgi:hypothetical protein
MTQQFRLTFPAPGTAADDGIHRIAQIARASVLVMAVALLVAPGGG